MIKVDFIEDLNICEKQIKFVVIVAYYNNKLLLVRHKDRSTWEIPGGHTEITESSFEAAKRELYEETGAKIYDLNYVCTYNVSRGTNNSYGHLYYANIEKLGILPDYEIKEIKTCNKLPQNLTYPKIQTQLYYKVKNIIKTEVAYHKN